MFTYLLVIGYFHIMFNSDFKKNITEYRKFMIAQAGSDDGFMGRTHALSAVALILAVFAFIPSVITKLADGSSHESVFAMIALITLVSAGGALIPDLDNTNSSAESQLGIFGTMLSAFMRATAPLVKAALHTKYDKNIDNAHRGFYHTGLCAVLMGALFAFLCSPVINFKVGPVTCNGRTVALILAFISTDLALSTIIGAIWKSKKTLDMIISLSMSFGIAWLLLSIMPAHVPYTLIGLLFGLSMLIHDLGDCFTTQGAPILFPLPIRGKMWYDVRFLKIKAGGLIENYVFMPVFIVIIILSLFMIIF